MHSRFLTIAAVSFCLGLQLQTASGEDDRPYDLRWSSGWSLIGIVQDGKTTVPHNGELVSVKFEERRFLADFGINGGSGSFSFGKAPGSITFGEFGVTEMGGPPQLMKQEMVLVDLFVKIRQFRIEDDELFLSDAVGKNGLKYKPIKAPEPLSLIGPDWKLQYIEMSDGVSVAMERPAVANAPTFRFNKKGVVGTTGLRPFTASYEGGFGEILKFGRLSPEGDEPKSGARDSEFETKYIGLLGRITRFSIKGSRLTFSDSEGTVNLVYSPAE